MVVEAKLHLPVQPYSNTYVACTTAAIATVISRDNLDGQIGNLLGSECIFALLEDDNQNDYVLAKSRSWKDTLKHRGIEVHGSTLPDSREATWQVLQGHLANNLPVLILIDMYYFRCSSLYQRYHQPHFTVLSGYDLDKGEVYVADSIGGFHGGLTIEEILDAMWSPFCANESRPQTGMWFTLQTSNSRLSYTFEQIVALLEWQCRASYGDLSCLDGEQFAYFEKWTKRLGLQWKGLGLACGMELAYKIEHLLPGWQNGRAWSYLGQKFDPLCDVLEQRWLHGQFLNQLGPPWDRWAINYLDAANQWLIIRNLCHKASRRRDITLLPPIAERIRQALSLEQSACDNIYSELRSIGIRD